MVELLSVAITLILLMAFASMFRARELDPSEPYALDSLKAASRHLGGFRPITGDTLAGEVDGVPLRYRLGVRGHASSVARWTEVEVDVPHVRLSLHLRPRANGAVRLPNMVVVGDATFDQMFVLEAAPADVARRLFLSSDEHGRSLASRLIGLGPIWIVPIATGFRLAVVGWQDRPARVDELLSIAAAIGSRLGEAVRAADRTAAVAGSPYRPEIDHAALARLQEERDQDLARLGATERRELTRLWLVFGLALTAVLSFPVLMAIL